MLNILKIDNPETRNRLQVYLVAGKGDLNDSASIEKAVFAPSANAEQALKAVNSNEVTKYLGTKNPTLWRVSMESDKSTWVQVNDIADDYNYDTIASIVNTIRTLLVVKYGFHQHKKTPATTMFNLFKEVIDTHYNIEIKPQAQRDPISSLLRLCFNGAVKLQGNLTPDWWRSISALNVTSTTASTVSIAAFVVTSLLDRKLEFNSAKNIEEHDWKIDDFNSDSTSHSSKEKWVHRSVNQTWIYRLNPSPKRFESQNELKLQNTLWRINNGDGFCYFTTNQLPRSEELTKQLAAMGNERCKQALLTESMPSKALGDVYNQNLLSDNILMKDLKSLPLQVHVGNYCWIDFDCTINVNFGDVSDKDRLSYDRARKYAANKYGLASLGTKLMHPLSKHGEVTPVRREIRRWFEWCDELDVHFVSSTESDEVVTPPPRKKPTRPTVKIQNAPTRATIRQNDFDEIFDVAKMEFSNICKKAQKKLGISLPEMTFEQFYDTQGRFREFAIIEPNEGRAVIEVNIGYNLNKVDLTIDEKEPTIHYINQRLEIDDTYHLNGYLRQRAIEVVSDYIASKPLSFSEKLVEHPAIDNSDITKKRALTSKLIDIVS